MSQKQETTNNTIDYHYDDQEAFDYLINREDFSWYDKTYKYTQIICDIENHYIEELKEENNIETREDFEYRFNDESSIYEYQNFMTDRASYAPDGQHINNNKITLQDVNAIMLFCKDYEYEGVDIQAMINFVVYTIAGEIWEMIEPHKKVILERNEKQKLIAVFKDYDKKLKEREIKKKEERIKNKADYSATCDCCGIQLSIYISIMCYEGVKDHPKNEGDLCWDKKTLCNDCYWTKGYWNDDLNSDNEDEIDDFKKSMSDKRV